MSTESKRNLALAIYDFLSKSLQDGTIEADDKESIEIAQNMITDAFKVDPSDKAAMSNALGGQNLLSIYGVFEKMKSTRAANTPKSPPPTTASSTKAPVGPSEADKAKAETLKSQGNTAMQSKDYRTAINYYSQALELYPKNPIYLSNRAAAYSGVLQHKEAVIDAQAAIDADPKFSKAYSRLGLAKYASGDIKGSVEAYKKGIEVEGKGGSEAMRRGLETAKKRLEEDDIGAPDAGTRSPPPYSPAPGGAGGGMPDLTSLAGMFGGGGRGGGGGGGMPDLGSLMSNPMFASIAQNVMSNPEMLSSIMSNPRVAQMMQGANSGGGMPDMSEMMKDPSIAELAKNILGGGGAGRGGGAPPPA